MLFSSYEDFPIRDRLVYTARGPQRLGANCPGRLEGSELDLGSTGSLTVEPRGARRQTSRDLEVRKPRRSLQTEVMWTLARTVRTLARHWRGEGRAETAKRKIQKPELLVQTTQKRGEQAAVGGCGI